MKLTLSTALIALLFAVAGCANTIQGAGEDAAATVDATQDAAGNVVDAID